MESKKGKKIALNDNMYILYHMYICLKLNDMRKNIDIDNSLLTKLKILSAFEGMSVKGLMEYAISYFVEQKEKERFSSLTVDEREDFGLWLLMQQANKDETVSEEEIMSAL